MSKKLQIPSHVLAFGLVTAPGVLYAMYWMKNHQNDEEMEKILKVKYGSEIKDSRDKREKMIEVLSALKSPGSNPELERKVDSVLYGGTKR